MDTDPPKSSRLEFLAATRDSLPALIRDAITAAREAGKTWPVIAAELGVSVRGAQKAIERARS